MLCRRAWAQCKIGNGGIPPGLVARFGSVSNLHCTGINCAGHFPYALRWGAHLALSNRAVLMPLLGTVLILHCLNRAVSVPLFGTGLILYCRNRAGLMPVLGTGIMLYCRNRAVMYRAWPSVGIAVHAVRLGQGQSSAMDMAPECRGRVY